MADITAYNFLPMPEEKSGIGFVLTKDPRTQKLIAYMGTYIPNFLEDIAKEVIITYGVQLTFEQAHGFFPGLKEREYVTND